METSKALERARELQEKGMHPSLIFFSKELLDNQVSRCMQILHGSHLKGDKRTSKHFERLAEINDILLASEPRLGIMFAKVPAITYDKVPGFISVPIVAFSVDSLCEYLKKAENITNA